MKKKHTIFKKNKTQKNKIYTRIIDTESPKTFIDYSDIIYSKIYDDISLRCLNIIQIKNKQNAYIISFYFPLNENLIKYYNSNTDDYLNKLFISLKKYIKKNIKKKINTLMIQLMFLYDYRITLKFFNLQYSFIDIFIYENNEIRSPINGETWEYHKKYLNYKNPLIKHHNINDDKNKIYINVYDKQYDIMKIKKYYDMRILTI